MEYSLSELSSAYNHFVIKFILAKIYNIMNFRRV